MTKLEKLRNAVDSEEDGLREVARDGQLSICLADVWLTPTPTLVLFHRALGCYIDAVIALETAEQAEYAKAKERNK